MIYTSYGSIEGYLVSLGDGIGIRDFVSKKVISCDFPDELFKQAEGLINKKVYIFGIIRKYFHGDIIEILAEELKALPLPSQESTLESILERLREDKV